MSMSSDAGTCSSENYQLEPLSAPAHCVITRSLGCFIVSAEIGSVHPRAGGYYRVVADCYHPALAFSLNWAQTLMQGAGAAGVAFIGAEYLVGLLLPPERRGGNSVFL